MAKFVKGARVLPSGAGRTATWPKTPGTVTRQMSGKSVEVVWDGTHYGDQMEQEELIPVGQDDRPGFTPAEKSERQAVLDAVLGAERFDDQTAAAAGIRLYPATINGQQVLVSIPEE
jgi:hypothetical protein